MMKMKILAYVAGFTLLFFSSASAQDSFVTVFQHCDYGGYAVTLKPGDYTLDALVSIGVKNDSISAIKVPKGLKAVVYENDHFDGKEWTFTESNPCIEDIEINDMISSIKVMTELP